MRLLSLAVVALAPMFGAVDPSLIGLAMPDAKAIAGLDVQQSKNSSFGSYLLSQIDNHAFELLTRETGLDPRTDVQQIVAASTAQGRSSLVVVKGRFTPQRLIDMAAKSGATQETYKGVTMLHGMGDLEGVAFLDTSTILAGTLADVKAAIDRKQSNATFTGALAQRSKEMAAANDAWFATNVSLAEFSKGRVPAQLGGNGGGFGNALEAITQGSGGVKFAAAGATLNLEATARSPQDAQALADVLRFGASMVQMQRNKGDNQAKAASLLDAATFVASGSVTRISILVPEQILEQLYKTPKARAQVR